MKLRLLLLIAMVIAAVAQLSNRTTAQSEDVKAAYDRADSLNRRTQGLVVNVAEAPNFLEGTSNLWYRKSVKGGNEFVLVLAAATTKAPAFDHTRLAASLGAAASASYTAVTLPFSTFTFVNDMQAIEFSMSPAGRVGARLARPPMAGADPELQHLRPTYAAGPRPGPGAR